MDGTPLETRVVGPIELGDCERCHGVWVPGHVTLALLKGEIEVPAEHEAPSEPAAATPWPRRVVCTDCNGRLRPTVESEVMSCVRCGALWIPSGNLGDLAQWHRRSLQAGALALLQPTAIPSDPRATMDVSKLERVVVGALAAFALVIALGSRAGPGFFGAIRPYVMGVAGLALIASGARFPSRASPGALSRKGFGYAIAGVGLVILALLDLR